MAIRTAMKIVVAIIGRHVKVAMPWSLDGVFIKNPQCHTAMMLPWLQFDNTSSHESSHGLKQKVLSLNQIG